MESRNRAPIRIGNGAGFWGDNLDAPFLLARDGKLDVLTLEYLAELTLGILSHQRVKDPTAGFVTDFPELLDRLAPLLQEQPALRIVTNAGGLNPRSCAVASGRHLGRADLGDLAIGIVAGDDVLEQIPEWMNSGLTLDHLETGEPLSMVADRLQSASVYLGARPIAEALGQGARIVLTGRVADASLTLGPAVVHHGWGWDDWDRLAGASAAGHLIECGAQVTGGLWHEWDQLHDLAGIGYPIAEVAADGSSVITKPQGTGGLVSVATVTEQLLYEIDDPARYRTPDVDVDFTSLFSDRERNGPCCRPQCDWPPAVRPAQACHRLPRRLDSQRHAGRRWPRRREKSPRGGRPLARSRAEGGFHFHRLVWWNAWVREMSFPASVRPAIDRGKSFFASRSATPTAEPSIGSAASSRHW